MLSYNNYGLTFQNTLDLMYVIMTFLNALPVKIYRRFNNSYDYFLSFYAYNRLLYFLVDTLYFYYKQKIKE